MHPGNGSAGNGVPDRSRAPAAGVRRDPRPVMGDTARMTASRTAVPEDTPVWTAAAVARRLGMAPGTLRSWSQRHGIGPAGHAPGRHRRYSAADVAELETIRDLVEQGMALSAAAALVRRDRAVPGRPVPAPPTGPATVSALVDAAARLDAAACDAIVMRGLARLGVVAGWDELCRPAFGGLDRAVADDAGCTDSQLLLSGIVVAALRRVPTVPGTRPVLLACVAGEHHTLGLEALYAALSERGVPARMLGADVPEVALLHATAHLRPRAVVVWAHRRATAAPAVPARLGGGAGTVLAAGPGWVGADLPPGVTRIDNLTAALALARGAGPRSLQTEIELRST